MVSFNDEATHQRTILVASSIITSLKETKLFNGIGKTNNLNKYLEKA